MMTPTYDPILPHSSGCTTSRQYLMWISLLLIVNVPMTSSHCSVATIFGLNTADCSNRSLQTVPSTLRDDIKVIKFSDNHLTGLDADSFRSYPHLQEIDVARNQIDGLTPETFRGLLNLQVVDFEGNALKSLPVSAFQYMTALRIISFKNNHIGYVPEDAFISLPLLERLVLEGCRLYTIHPLAFNGLHRLLELSLINNQLKTFHPQATAIALLDTKGDTMDEMCSWLPDSLRIIRLHWNPWLCDCRLRCLRYALRTLSWEFGSGEAPRCAGPEPLRGISWSHLTPEQFACPSEARPRGATSVTLRPGLNVTMECLVSGEPEPAVWWTKDSKPLVDVKSGGGGGGGGSRGGEGLLGSADGYKITRNYLWTLKLERKTLTSLMLYDVNEAYAGEYKCNANNSAGRAQVVYKLPWSTSNFDEEALTTDGNEYSWSSMISAMTSGLDFRQRMAVALCFAILLLVCVGVVLAMCLITQRRRWKNVYKVADSTGLQTTGTTGSSSTLVGDIKGNNGAQEPFGKYQATTENSGRGPENTHRVDTLDSHVWENNRASRGLCNYSEVECDRTCGIDCNGRSGLPGMLDGCAYPGVVEDGSRRISAGHRRVQLHITSGVDGESMTSSTVKVIDYRMSAE